MDYKVFFDKHPEYRSCPIYIAGESYAAKYIPNIALKIHFNNSNAGIETINLKGISIGDGWINSELQMKIYIDYEYTLGYLDTLEYNNCLDGYQNISNALQRQD